MFDMAKAMKQMQKLQTQMQQAQEELAHKYVTGEAGAGLVKIEMSCRHVVKSIKIDESLMKDDKEMLEDLIGAAFNDALRKVEQETSEGMSHLTNGLQLPAGMKFPGM